MSEKSTTKRDETIIMFLILIAVLCLVSLFRNNEAIAQVESRPKELLIKVPENTYIYTGFDLVRYDPSKDEVHQIDLRNGIRKIIHVKTIHDMSNIPETKE